MNKQSLGFDKLSKLRQEIRFRSQGAKPKAGKRRADPFEQPSDQQIQKASG